MREEKNPQNRDIIMSIKDYIKENNVKVISVPCNNYNYFDIKEFRRLLDKRTKI